MKIKFKQTKGFYFLLLNCMVLTMGYSQNQFPTNQDVFLDGRSVIFRMPTTTGGWARGNYFEDPTGSEYWGGIGLYGNASTLNHIFISPVASPWNSGVGIFIKGSGNVGVGTTSPTDLLHISSSAATVFRLHTESTTDNSTIKFTGKRSSGVNSTHYIGTGGVDNKNFILDVDESLLIKNNSSTSMIVDGDGDVGIGLATVPSGYKLAVEGKIRTREIRVDQDTWPDYVFEKGYELPTLEEIEKHIDEKGHLPKIPSAEEVMANGVELGEMDRLLLEKIEELTLFIISQHKELKEQKVRNDDLEKEVVSLRSDLNNLKK